MKKNKIQQQVQTAKTFETLVDRYNHRSKKTAWIIAGCSFVVMLISVLAISFLVPLKEKELAIVRVDNTTGRTELLTQVSQEKILQEEALGRYFVSQYIKLREGYNYPSLQNDYDLVQRYSSNAVKEAYLLFFDSDKSPDKVYNNNSFQVSVQMIQLVLTPATEPDILATVRFKKTILNLKTGEQSQEYWGGRMTYHFDLSKEGTSEEKEQNPLGFTVTSFVMSKEMQGG